MEDKSEGQIGGEEQIQLRWGTRIHPIQSVKRAPDGVILTGAQDLEGGEGRGSRRGKTGAAILGDAVCDQLAAVACSLVLGAVVSAGKGGAAPLVRALKRTKAVVDATVSASMSTGAKVFAAIGVRTEVANLAALVGLCLDCIAAQR